ncbi:MAG: hypothetical protein AAFQ91_25725 [Cyanobacteria bacterium J06621_15]
MNNKQENQQLIQRKKIKECLSWVSIPPARHTILAGGLLLLFTIFGSFLNWEGERIARDWYSGTEYFQVKSKTEPETKVNSEEAINVYLNAFKTSTSAEKKRIIQQLEIIELNAKNHVSITLYFYTRIFTEITVASVSGIIAAICLFYISRIGWDKANNYIINIFVVTTGVTVFVGSLPIVFQQEQNIQDNTKLYLNYINLKNKILTSLATQKNQKEETIELSQIILNTEKELKELNRISIGFDTTAIPKNPDIINSLTNSGTTTN